MVNEPLCSSSVGNVFVRKRRGHRGGHLSLLTRSAFPCIRCNIYRQERQKRLKCVNFQCVTHIPTNSFLSLYVFLIPVFVPFEHMRFPQNITARFLSSPAEKFCMHSNICTYTTVQLVYIRMLLCCIIEHSLNILCRSLASVLQEQM